LLFNSAVSTALFMLSQIKWWVYRNLGGICSSRLKVVAWKSGSETEENHNKPHDIR